MSNSDEKEDMQKSEETRVKINKIGKIMFYATLIIVWTVTAALGIRDIWRDVGILETPWIIFSLVLSVVLIIVIIVPLYRSLRVDVRSYKERKEKEVDK
jgi:hypothetical protein